MKDELSKHFPCIKIGKYLLVKQDESISDPEDLWLYDDATGEGMAFHPSTLELIIDSFYKEHL